MGARIFELEPDWRTSWNGRGSILAIAVRRACNSSCQAAIEASLGATVMWRAEGELLLVGPGELPFTELLLARFRSSQELTDVVRDGGLQRMWDRLNDVVDAHVHVVRQQRLPMFARLGLRLVRLRGLLRTPVEEAHALDHRGGIYPTDQQLASLRQSTWPGEVTMVNYLKFRSHAAYDDEHPNSQLTGFAAYNRYGEVAIRNVYRLGGALRFTGRIEACLVRGDAAATDDSWDQLALVSYPDRAHFGRLPTSPGYAEATRHRDAGLESTALVMTHS